MRSKTSRVTYDDGTAPAQQHIHKVTFLEALHQRRLQEKLGQHIAVRHAGGAFAVQLHVIERIGAVVMHGEKAVKPCRREHSGEAGRDLDKIFLLRGEIDLGAQHGILKHSVGHLAKDADNKGRSPAQVMPIHAGMKKGAQHRRQRARAKNQPACAKPRQQVVPGVLCQRTGRAQLMVVVDRGLSLTHGISLSDCVACAMLAGEVPVVGRACGPLQDDLLGMVIIAAWGIRANDPNDRGPKTVQSVERQAPHAPHTKEEEETA